MKLECPASDPTVERLERRRLLAVAVDDRVLVIDGSAGDDVITVLPAGADQVVVDVNGDVATFDADDFDTIAVNAAGGNDRVTGGEWLAHATLRGGDGDDTLRPANSADDYVTGGGGDDAVEYRTPTENLRRFEGYFAADASSPTPYVIVGSDEVADRVAVDVERFVGGPGTDVFDVQRRGVPAVPADKPLTFEGGEGRDGFRPGEGLRTTQIGGAGDDNFEFAVGSDETVLGGDGEDLFAFTGAGRPNSVSGGTGADQLYLPLSDGPAIDMRLYPDVEHARGIPSGLTVIGNDLDNHLDVELRRDVGPVTLVGGGGNDTLVGDRFNSTEESLDGGAGDDVLVGDKGDDMLDGGAGTDTLFGGFGDDALLNGESDRLFHVDGGGTFRYEGTEAQDEVSIWADGAGGLVVWVDEETHTIDIDDVTSFVMNGRGGHDTLKLNPGLTMPATLNGGRGWDGVTGAGGDDVLLDDGDGGSFRGNGGDDHMRGSARGDEMRGGPGRDTADYSDRTGNLRIDQTDDRAQDGAGGENDYVAPDVEVLLVGAGDDRVFGSAVGNEVHGGGGNDTLHGGGGDDSLYGEGGRDKLHGDDGDDHLEGGAQNDDLYGDGGADTLWALAGNDRLFAAGDGADDSLRGGPGSDRYDADDDDELHSVEAAL